MNIKRTYLNGMCHMGTLVILLMVKDWEKKIYFNHDTFHQYKIKELKYAHINNIPPNRYVDCIVCYFHHVLIAIDTVHVVVAVETILNKFY